MTGQEIRTKRKAAGLTIQQLATRAGISFVTLQNIETGKTPHPHKLTMRAVESVLAEAEGPTTMEDVPKPM